MWQNVISPFLLNQGNLGNSHLFASKQNTWFSDTMIIFIRVRNYEKQVTLLLILKSMNLKYNTVQWLCHAQMVKLIVCTTFVLKLLPQEYLGLLFNWLYSRLWRLCALWQLTTSSSLPLSRIIPLWLWKMLRNYRQGLWYQVINKS